MGEIEYEFDVGEMVRDLANQLAEARVEVAQLRAILRKIESGKNEGGSDV